MQHPLFMANTARASTRLSWLHASYRSSIAVRTDLQKGTVHPQYQLSAILRSRGTGRTHHAVGMRHCQRSEECKGINTSFPRNALGSSFFWMVGPLGPGKMSKVYVLETFRDSKGINTAKRRRPNQAVTSGCTLIY